MDFDSFEYAMRDVGIAVGNAFGLLHGVRFDDDQASGLIRKGSGADQSALLLQAFKIVQVGGSMMRPLALPFGPIPSNDHVRHGLGISVKACDKGHLTGGRRSRDSFGQGSTSFVAVVDFMPPFDSFLTEPPAEIDHPSFHEIRKVA